MSAWFEERCAEAHRARDKESNKEYSLPLALERRDGPGNVVKFAKWNQLYKRRRRRNRALRIETELWIWTFLDDRHRAFNRLINVVYHRSSQFNYQLDRLDRLRL